jgi:hypothetical protein
LRLSNHKYHILIDIQSEHNYVILLGIIQRINYMLFNVHGSVHRNIIQIYVQQDAMLHSLFYLKIALHVSGGTSTHHQERKQLYLQHLVFVTL